MKKIKGQEREKTAVKLWKLPVDLKSGHAAIDQDFSVLCWTKKHRGMIVEVATLKQSESADSGGEMRPRSLIWFELKEMLHRPVTHHTKESKLNQNSKALETNAGTGGTSLMSSFM